MVSYSIKVNNEKTSFNYYSDIDFLTEIRAYMHHAKLLVTFNGKFDLNWLRRYGIVPPDRARVWDCQIAEFIIRGQQGAYPSLNEALSRFDLGEKDDKIAEYWALGIDTTDIPVDELRFYNNRDVELTYKLYLAQQTLMTDRQKKLCTVMGLDLLVLAEMEWNGVKFNVELCKEKADETSKELKIITDELLEYSPTKDINLDSGHQLSCLLYGGAFEITRVSHIDKLIYKSGPRKGVEYERNRYVVECIQCPKLFEPIKGSETKLISKTASGEYKVYATGEDILKQLRKPSKTHKRIIELLLQRAEQAKLLDTYYGKIPSLLETMEWGDILHGQYNACVAATGRLSSSNPNMQNFSEAVDQLLVSRF